ncbi:hypothetical protein GN956_G10438 [Arapaima gigas]
MLLLNNLAVVLALTCFAQKVLESDCQRDQGKKEGKESNSGDKERLPENSMVTFKVGHKKSRKMQLGFRGTITTRNKTRCTWVGSGEDTVILILKCKEGEHMYECEYISRPSACSQFAQNIDRFWKQISRALKKQKNLCQDSAVLIKAGMCRKAPREAHFKLNTPLTRHLPPYSASCADRIDQQKLASEYCSGSLLGFCTFLFSMVQNEDC